MKSLKSLKSLIHAIPLVFTVLFIAVVAFLLTQLAMQVAGMTGAILVAFFIALALLTLLRMGIEAAEAQEESGR